MAWTQIMGAGSVRYHRDTVLDRADDFPGQTLAYYGSRGETPMTWGGAGAVRLGLSGAIAHETYGAVFAEGGAYSWNDLEAPFQEGLFKLVLSAAVEMRDRSVEGPLWVQPVAIKYVFDESAERMLDRSLAQLESAVGLSGPVPEDFRERLLRIGSAVVGVVEVVVVVVVVVVVDVVVVVVGCTMHCVPVHMQRGSAEHVMLI